jgi:fibrillarin-like rRNA methylase
MSGPGEGKKLLKGVKFYIHEKGKSGASVTHLDIESPDLAKIIKENEITFVKGKSGGIFIALKKPMIERAEKIIRK